MYSKVATSKHIGLGFFTPEDSQKLEALRDVKRCKDYLRSVVAQQAPRAEPENVVKANEMIDKARDLKALLLGVWSFMLAHDGNKVIK